MSNDAKSGQPHRIHPNSLANLVLHKRPNWQKGTSPNPGGNPKSARVDIAYKRIIAMSEDELTTFVPKTGAEVMAMGQFKRACDPKTKNTLPYAQEVTNRTDGPLVRKIEKTDVTALQAERARFEAAIDALVSEEGCTRLEAALAIVSVEPSYRKFIEDSDNDSQ
jgi:hypothetical protein